MIRLLDVYQGGKVAAGAIDFLFLLLQERPSVANISHREMPSIEQHRQFVHRRPYWRWYLVENAEERVGSVYISHQNEIGIAIAQAHQRKGYARAALEELLRTHQPLDPVPSARRGAFVAHVAPGNDASHALFEGLGGKLIQVTYEL